MELVQKQCRYPTAAAVVKGKECFGGECGGGGGGKGAMLHAAL